MSGPRRGKACFLILLLRSLVLFTWNGKRTSNNIGLEYLPSEWFDIRFEHQDGPLFHLENAKTLRKAESVSSP